MSSSYVRTGATDTNCSVLIDFVARYGTCRAKRKIDSLALPIWRLLQHTATIAFCKVQMIMERIEIKMLQRASMLNVSLLLNNNNLALQKLVTKKILLFNETFLNI